MTFIIDSLLAFNITLDSLKLWIVNKNLKSFEFSSYKIKNDTLKISTKDIMGIKNYKLYYENGLIKEGRIYFEKGKSANYFLIFIELENWYALGVSQKPSSIWINDSVIDLINGEFFYKQLSTKPYKLKVIRNKLIILKDYKF